MLIFSFNKKYQDRLSTSFFLSDRSLSCLEIQQLFVSEGDTEYRDRELHYSKLNEHFLFLN